LEEPVTIQRVSPRHGIGGGKLPPLPGWGGGDGGEDERVFFDDGQVKVTESLVTIGPPWNKGFAVSQIHGVTHGKNRSMELSDAILRLVGMVLMLAGVLSLAAGFTVGFFAGVLTGIGVIWARAKPDAPFCVTLDFGDLWAKEYLSTANEAWAEAVATAVMEAMRHRNEGPGLIPGQDRLRN
jgi:hypothetical protein